MQRAINVKFAASCPRLNEEKHLPEFHCSSLERYTQEECCDHGGSSDLTMLHSTAAKYDKEKHNCMINATVCGRHMPSRFQIDSTDLSRK